MKCRPVGVFCLLVALPLLAGCGGSSKSDSQAGVTKVERSELVGVGDYLPPMDGGRVEMAPPEGWTMAPRGSKFLARFIPDADTDYPTILVTADDGDGVTNATSENLKKLAAEVKAAESVKQAKPITIGDKFHGVLYRKVNREKDSVNKVIDRLMVATVVDGRRYTVELRARSEASQRENQKYLFSVAYGLRFAKEGGEPVAAAAVPAEEPKADAKPAAKSEPKAEPKPEAKAAKPEAKPAPEAKPEPKEEPKAEPKEEPKPEPKKEPEKPKKKPAKSSDDLEGLDDLLN